MLIPRKFSDYIYDLDTKVVQKGVYCLGGPDVETWKCDKKLLLSKGELWDHLRALEYHAADWVFTVFSIRRIE